MTDIDEMLAWLRAALDEDERDADGIHRYEGGMSPLTCDHIVAAGHDRCTCGVPARVLREVEAKRRIIEWVLEQQVPHSTIGDDFWYPVAVLATAYFGRPGFRREWATR